MKTIIDADAAKKLAGLQIDQLQKYRDGHVTLEHLEWFNRLTRAERDRLSGEQFALVNAFSLKVPADYDHDTRLETFQRRFPTSWLGSNATDVALVGSALPLVPGRTYVVKVFQATRTATADDYHRFSDERHDPYLAGLQGLSLVWELKRKQLPSVRETAQLFSFGLWPRHGGARSGVCVLNPDFPSSVEFIWSESQKLRRGEYVLCFSEDNGR